jgi:hypothetical protein
MKVSELPWPRGPELLDIIKRDTNKVLLAFSRGKDSISAMLVLREAGFEVIPVFYYRVPGLGFVERSLAYYEKFFGVHIIRVPHPSTYRQLREFTFQPPSRISLIWEAGLPAITYDLLRQSIADDLGLPENQWIATGVRAADSCQRYMAIKRWGPIRRASCTFLPVWDMSKATLVSLIRRHGVRLPEEYRYFGRSFDGLDFRYLWGIKQRWPDDYAKILALFPLCELEIIRYERFQKRQEAARGQRRRPG